MPSPMKPVIDKLIELSIIEYGPDEARSMFNEALRRVRVSGQGGATGAEWIRVHESVIMERHPEARMLIAKAAMEAPSGFPIN